MDIAKLTWFFDGGIFALMALTGYLTVLIVWIEARLNGSKLTWTQWAIIMRSSAFAALFTFIFTEYFWHVPHGRVFLWTFRTFLATAMINYLACLVFNTKRRHNLSFRQLLSVTFKHVNRFRR